MVKLNTAGRSKAGKPPGQSHLSKCSLVAPPALGTMDRPAGKCWPNRSGGTCFGPVTLVACLLDGPLGPMLQSHIPFASGSISYLHPLDGPWSSSSPGLGLVMDPATHTWLCPLCSGAVGLCQGVRALLCLGCLRSWCVPRYPPTLICKTISTVCCGCRTTHQ